MNLCTSTNTLYERADGCRIPAAESIRLCAEAGYKELDFCFVDQVFGKTEFLGPDWRSYVASFREQAESWGSPSPRATAPSTASAPDGTGRPRSGCAAAWREAGCWA